MRGWEISHLFFCLCNKCPKLMKKIEAICLNPIFSRKVLKILKIISNIHNTNICDITKDLFEDIYFINFKEIFC